MSFNKIVEGPFHCLSSNLSLSSQLVSFQKINKAPIKDCGKVGKWESKFDVVSS